MGSGYGEVSRGERWLPARPAHAVGIAKDLLEQRVRRRSVAAACEPVADDEADADRAEETHGRHAGRKGTASDLGNDPVIGEENEE